jgi:autotransporter-associated beta strand protein
MDIVRFSSLSRRLLLVALTALAAVVAQNAMATDFGALSSGTWTNPAIWTPAGGPPDIIDDAYIGSNYPGGAAAAANVSLGGNQTVNNVFVGYGAATSSGTLNLAGNALTVDSTFGVGQSGGKGTIVHNGGWFSTPNFNIDGGSSIILTNSDSITSNLNISDTSQVTTASVGNVGNSAAVDLRSTLTLGASMALSSNLSVERSSTLNMANQGLSANTIYFGWSYGQPVTVTNRGPITTGNLYVGAGTFNISASDAVTYFNLDNSASTLNGNVSSLTLSDSSRAATTLTGSVTGSVSLDLSSTLTLAAPMTLSGNLDLERGSTFNMAGNRLNAASVYLGWSYNQPYTIAGRAPITTSNLYLGVGTFNLAASDAVANLSISNSSQMSTIAPGNLTQSALVDGGGTLTLGASMSLAGQLDIERGSTFNMAGNPLNASTLAVGWYNNQPVSVLNRGPITAANLYVGIGSFDVTASDSVTSFSLDFATSTLHNNVANLSLSDTSQATTTPTGNVTNSVALDLSSTLTLGTSMALTGNLDLERSATLNMANHPVSAQSVLLGWYNGLPFTISNRGPISASNLYLGVGTFNLTSSDTVATLYLSTSAQLSTAVTGNITQSANVDLSSTLSLAAPMVLSGNLDLERTSTLNMAGLPLTASAVFLSWFQQQPFSVLNRGPITATNLEVGYGTLDVTASDSVTNLYLDMATSTLHSTVSTISLSHTAQATTTAAGNVTGSVTVDTGSALTLGASMALSGNLDLERSATLDMAGHPVSANAVYVGWFQAQPISVVNRAAITATNLQLAGGPFNLIAGDAISNLYVSNSATMTTAATSNVTQQVNIDLGGSLTLGSSMTLGNSFDVERGGVANMANQALTATSIYIGWFQGQPANVINSGSVTTNGLYVAGGSTVTLRAPGSTVNNAMTISNNSTLTLQQPAGQLTGLTFHASTSSALTINDTSVLQLSGGSNSNPAWLFRWQDVSGSWESTLKGLITAGRIAVSSTSGYSVFDDEGYTYVATPSTLIWNGAGANNNWSTAGNWGGTTPSAGHWLRFGPLAVGGHTANTNNLTAGSLFYGIFFDAAAPSYNLQGNAIQLSGDVLNQSGTNQTIGLNIQLVPGDGAFNQDTFDTGTMKITDSGSISGAGMNLIKTGSGTLVLSGTNTYSGGTIVKAGKLMVTTPYGILDGTDLTIGANAAAIFAAPTVGAPDVALTTAPAAVPEPGSFALLAAILACIAGTATAFKRSGRR